MSQRTRISSGTVWEERVGYSRALRAGPHVWVAGTTAYDEQGRLVGPGDAYAQTVSICDIGRAHAGFFRNIRLVATMLGIPALVEPGMLIEIEVDAYVGEKEG